MAGRTIKLHGPSVVKVMFADSNVEFPGVDTLEEASDGTLRIKRGDTFTTVRPTYLFFEVYPDPGEEADDRPE